MSTLNVNKIVPVDTPNVEIQGLNAPTYNGKELATLLSPAFSGVSTSTTPPAGDNSNRIATTQFVTTATPVPTLPSGGGGTVYSGVSAKYAREDHSHPTDITRAPLVSPAFGGVPSAPTWAMGTSTGALATTKFACPNFSHTAVLGGTFYDTLPSGLIILGFNVVFTVAGYATGDIPTTGSNISVTIPNVGAGIPTSVVWMQAQLTATNGAASTFAGVTSITSLTSTTLGIKLEEFTGSVQTCTINCTLFGKA
jgi:hypothetical protein